MHKNSYHTLEVAGNTVVEEGGTSSVLDIAIAMGLVAIAVRLVARSVGAGASRVRISASVRVVRIISIGSIVVMGRSVGGRSVGAVTISRGVGRGVVSIVGGGIAAVAAIGTGRMHRRLA